MGLRETTRSIITLVEEKSGFPVLVSEDPSLQVLAMVRMARGDVSVHTIVYNPSGRAGAQPDYLIAYQCGFILRHFAPPPERRFDFSPAGTGRDTVGRLLSDPQGTASKLGLSPTVREQLCDQLFDGLMRQLRSIPVGMRVDTWIRDSYPDLAPLQRRAALRQLQDNQGTLGPDARKIAPKKVYTTSVAMNAAFAAFWAREFDDPALSVPYRTAGYHKAGNDLLELFDRVPTEANNDRELIDSWGHHLSLSSWYRWIPYVVSKPAAA
jgi:hypothetical protein